MTEVVVVAAKRSAIGSFGGVYKNVTAVDLGTQVVKAAMESIDLFLLASIGLN